MANEMTTVNLTEALNGTVSQNDDVLPMDSIAMKKTNGLTNGITSRSRDSSTMHRKLRKPPGSSIIG